MIPFRVARRREAGRLLATRLGLEGRRVPFPGHETLGDRLLDPGEVRRRQGNVDRGDALLETRPALRSGDRDDVVPSAKDPGERELGGGSAHLPGHDSQFVHQLEVPLQVLSLEPGVSAPKVLLREGVDGTDLRGKETAAEWTERNEPDPLPDGFPRSRRDPVLQIHALGLGPGLQQRPPGFAGREGRVPRPYAVTSSPGW